MKQRYSIFIPRLDTLLKDYGTHTKFPYILIH